MKRAKIFYCTLQDEQTKEEKLRWFDKMPFENISFDHIMPDLKSNWVNLTDNDFDGLLELTSKEVKDGTSELAVFMLFSRGVETTRDEWVYEFSSSALSEKIAFFIRSYNKSAKSGEANDEIKWSSSLKAYASNGTQISYQENLIIKSLYRPYFTQFFYSEKVINQRLSKKSL